MTTSSSHTSYLRRGAVALSAVSLAGFLVDYAFNLGLTRLLTPHGYGDFKVAHSFGYFFGLAVLLGGDRAAFMVLAPCLERGQPRRVWEYLRFYLRDATLLGLGVIALTWTLSALHVSSSDPLAHHPLAWAAVAVPLNAAAAMISRTLQAARKPAQAVVPWRLGLPLLQLALFGVAVAVWGQLTVFTAIVISVVATALVTLWQWRRVRSLGLIELERDRDFYDGRAWLTASLPMMGSFLVALALNQSDLYFLEVLGDEGEVGHYAAAATAAHFLTLIQVTVIGLFAPIVHSALEAGAASSRATYRQALSWMLAVLTPIGLLMALLGEPILALFGPRYRIGHTVLLLLLLGNFTWAAAAVSSLWLQYRGRAQAVLVISIATLAADSALNLLLIPRYGMTGAAGSTALTFSAAAAAILLLHRTGRGEPA